MATEIEPKLHPKFRTLLTRPNAATGGMGPFTLPAEFDSEEFASCYKEEGPDVLQAQQPQPLDGLPLMAPGWHVWHDKQKQTHKVTSGGKKYVLMYRPQEVQREVNAAYGELSRARKENREALADTAAGLTNVPRGAILSEAQMEKIDNKSKK